MSSPDNWAGNAESRPASIVRPDSSRSPGCQACFHARNGRRCGSLCTPTFHRISNSRKISWSYSIWTKWEIRFPFWICLPMSVLPTALLILYWYLTVSVYCLAIWHSNRDFPILSQLFVFKTTHRLCMACSHHRLSIHPWEQFAHRCAFSDSTAARREHHGLQNLLSQVWQASKPQ